MFGTNYQITMKDGRKVYLFNARTKLVANKPFPLGFFSDRHEAGQWFDMSHIDKVEERGPAKIWHPVFKAVSR